MTFIHLFQNGFHLRAETDLRWKIPALVFTPDAIPADCVPEYRVYRDVFLFPEIYSRITRRQARAMLACGAHLGDIQNERGEW